MDVEIKVSKAKGRVLAPPSKSMSHRYLICGALSNKTTRLKNIGFSEDIKATMGSLEALGASFTVEEQQITISPIDFKGFREKVGRKELFCNESGSTLRFLIPVAMLYDKEITLTGTEKLLSRSLKVYEDAFLDKELGFAQGSNWVRVRGPLKEDEYHLAGDVSSQFISGLMFALPLLEGHSRICISGKLESGSYIDLTEKTMQDYGVKVKRSHSMIEIEGCQQYQGGDFSVEGDYSNSAFLDAFNLFGGEVKVENLDENSKQGDRVYREMFEKLSKESPSLDISDCPDLGPILMAVAAAKNGAILTGTKRLKIKESDRGLAMATELKKFGCQLILEENRIIIPKCKLEKPKECLYGHNDHRIVMSLSVLLSITGGTIKGAEAVKKSFPNFFDVIKKLNVELSLK